MLDGLPKAALPIPGPTQQAELQRLYGDMEAIRLPNGVTAFLRHRHVAIVAQQRGARIPTLELLFGNGVREDDLLATVWRKLPGTLDGKPHRICRQKARRLFAPNEELREYARAVSRDLLLTIVDAGHGDLVSGFAFPYMATVTERFLGEGVDAAAVTRWSEALNRCFYEMSPSEVNDAKRAVLEIHRTVEGRMRVERSSAQGLMDRMIASGEWDAVEVMALVANSAFGGYDTTAKSIANMFLTLLTHPRERHALRDDPESLAAAVEESLRFEPSVAGVTRVIENDWSCDGIPVSAGIVIALGLISNRDREVFSDPSVYQPTRRPNPHVTFGGASPHHCLGAPLARVVMQEALRAFVRHGFELELERPAASLRWFSPRTFRGVAQLPVRRVARRPLDRLSS